MTSDERLAFIHIKIERAKKHIRELDAEIRSFLAAKPYRIGTKRNPQTRQLIYYIASVRETPATMAAITGDVLQNLRSSLDHLAYQLILVGSGTTPSARIYFPIADDATKYKVGRAKRVRGMRPSAIKAIDGIKPYKGGNDTLWRLHKLNNVDKHRMLITVGSAFRSLDLGGFTFRRAKKLWKSDPNFHRFANQIAPKAFFSDGNRMFPLKAGDVLFTDAPDAEVDKELEFRFDVAFGEPEIVEGESLLESLQHMADVVDQIVTTFKPLLA
jgi:hypothetical protein